MRTQTWSRCVAALGALALTGALAACGDNVDPGRAPSASASSVSGSFAGAGASSQQTAVEAWIAGYQKRNPKARISYNPSGSGAGVTTFLTGATVWAGSDRPLDDGQVEASKAVCDGRPAFDVPVYLSPLAVVFNLRGVSDAGKHVNMDAATLAKVFDGRITRWNDKAIAAQNPDLELPDTPVTVVHRSDKSGTTLNFVEYLKAAAPKDWPYDLSENWPADAGQGAKGTSGVISTIDLADGTIGYADYSQVGDLGTVAIKVGDGYSEISAEAASKAVADSTLRDEPTPNRVVLDVNHTTDVEGAYPIVLVSYDVACPAYRDENTARFAKSWLGYVVSDAGQRQAMRATGSAALPRNIASLVRQSVDAIETK